ncbi:MAG: WD40 repeat domain-containing protein, partial [Planctomycetota bacterium]
GDRIFAGGVDGTVRSYDVATGKIIHSIRAGQRIIGLTLNSKGDCLQVSIRNQHILLFDPETLERRGEPVQNDFGASVASFSPDGERLLVGGWGRTARVFDLDGEPETPPLFTGFSTRFLTYSPSGGQVGINCEDGRVSFWDSWTGEHREPTLNYKHYIRVFRYAPNAHLVALASDEGVVRIWSLARNNPRHEPIETYGWIWCTQFSPDGRWVAAGSDAGIRMWDVDTSLPVSKWIYHPGGVYDCEFSPDGRVLASAGRDAKLRFSRVPDGEELHVRSITSLSRIMRFTPDGKLLCVGEASGVVSIWEVETGKRTEFQAKHGGKVRGLSVSPDGRWLATGGHDARVAVRDIESGELRFPIIDAKGLVHSTDFSADGSLLLASAQSLGAAVWDAETGEELYRFEDLGTRRGFASFAPEGYRMVQSVNFGAAVVRDARSGETVTPRIDHPGAVWRCGFDPTGRFFVTTSGDSFARIWGAGTGEMAAVPMKHGDWAEHYDFHPTRPLLATGSLAGRIKLWDFSSFEGSLEELEAVVTVLTARRLGGKGKTEVLNLEDYLAAWNHAKALVPNEFRVPKRELIDWNRRELIRARLRQDYLAMAFHGEQLVRLEPEVWTHFQSASAAHRQLGNWTKAAIYGAKVLELQGKLRIAK